MSSSMSQFDSVASVRKIRDRISAQIAGMTLAEQLEWMAAQPIDDPFLRRLRERTAQQGDAAGDASNRR